MVKATGEVEYALLRLRENGLPDSVAADSATVARLEQARVRSLQLAVDPAQPGRGMQWALAAVSSRAVAHVQSSHVHLCVNPEELKSLPTGWHTDATSMQGRNFVYCPEAGVLLFRERQGVQYRWVPFAHRATPGDAITAEAITVGSGPELRPTAEGRLIVSKFGVVYASRFHPNGTLIWEQLLSPGPLWFDSARMPRVPGFSSEVATPSSIEAIAHLESSARLTRLMEERSLQDLPSHIQQFRTAVAELGSRTADWIEHTDKSPRRDTHADTGRRLALGSRLARLVSMLQETLTKAQRHPELVADTAGQQQLAQLTDRIRACITQGPDAVWLLEEVEARRVDLGAYMEQREAGNAAQKNPDLQASYEAALHRLNEQIAAMGTQLPKMMEPLTRALQAFASAVRGTAMLMASLDSPIYPAEIFEELKAQMIPALSKATEPFNPGSQAPAPRAVWFYRAMVGRTVALLSYVFDLPVATKEQRIRAGLAVRALVVMLSNLRDAEGEALYESGQGPVFEIEQQFMREALRRRNKPVLAELLAMMTDSLLEMYRDLSQYSEANYADISLRHGHLLFARETLAVCQSLNERARSDTSQWTGAEWEIFVHDLHLLWKIGGASPNATALADVRKIETLRADMLRRALALSASVEPKMVRLPVEGSAQLLESCLDDGGRTRLERLAVCISTLEAEGVPAARCDASTNARIVIDPSVDPRGGTPDVVQVDLTSVQNTRVLYVGPSPMVETVRSLIFAASPLFEHSEVTLPPDARVWLPKPPEVTLATQAVAAVISETQRAAWRSAAKQTAQAARDVLLSVLKKPLKSHPWLAKKISELLESEYGEGALSYALGLALELKRTDARSLRLAAELRVEGEATAFTAVIEPLRVLITENLEAVLKVADDTVVQSMPDLPALEAPKPIETPFAAPEKTADAVPVGERT